MEKPKITEYLESPKRHQRPVFAPGWYEFWSPVSLESCTERLRQEFYSQPYKYSMTRELDLDYQESAACSFTIRNRFYTEATGRIERWDGNSAYVTAHVNILSIRILLFILIPVFFAWVFVIWVGMSRAGGVDICGSNLIVWGAFLLALFTVLGNRAEVVIRMKKSLSETASERAERGKA